MGQVRLATLDDPRQFDAVKAVLEGDHPGIVLSRLEIEGRATLRAERGGMRVFWLYRGEGEVFLPAGYRTQEGDGAPLPAEYAAEPLAREIAETLDALYSGIASLASGAVVPVRAIVGRRRGGEFVGDIAGDLWRLEQTPRPWSSDAAVEAAIERLFAVHRRCGYATKQAGSFEPIQEGDQLIAAGDEAVEVRGRFACLSMENVQRATSHISTARRLRYLLDTAGGCNPDFAPFRRLPLTWFPVAPSCPGGPDPSKGVGSLCFDGNAWRRGISAQTKTPDPFTQGDGLNWVNSHVVNIPKETSPTHFHPLRPAIGGKPQTEMYLVLDPGRYGLDTFGRAASLVVYPDLRDLRRCEQHAMTPGTFVYIPPQTGHRGLDVLVNVLTLPGFKPHNELYLDRDLHDRAGDAAPYNENLLDTKNYERLEDVLE